MTSNLIEGFDNNIIDKLDLQFCTTTESLLSKIYLCRNKVYKIYKHADSFIGDFSDKNFRSYFYKEDFEWNNLMDSSTYLSLRGVRHAEQIWEHTTPAEAEDFYIEMERVNTNNVLTKVLLRGEVSDAILQKLTREMYLKIEALTSQKKGSMEELFQKNWSDHQEEYLDDLKNWAYMGAPNLDMHLSNDVINSVGRSVKNLEYFQKFPSSSLQVAIDNQSENILIEGDKIGFMDIMPPKEKWRIADGFFNVTRVATDVRVLSNSEQARAVYTQYEKLYPKAPEIIEILYELRSSLLRCAYTYVLGDKLLGDKYNSYIRHLMTRIPVELKP